MSFDPAADPERRRAKSKSVERRLALQKGEAAGTKVPDVSPEEKEFIDWLNKRSWKD